MDARLRELERRAKLGDKDAQNSLRSLTKKVENPLDKIREIYREACYLDPILGKNENSYATRTILFDIRTVTGKLSGILEGTLTSKRQYNQAREYLYRAENQLILLPLEEESFKPIILTWISTLRKIYQEMREIFDQDKRTRKRQRKSARRKNDKQRKQPTDDATQALTNNSLMT